MDRETFPVHNDSMEFTRRQTSLFLVSGVVASAMPVPGLAASDADWARRLQADLSSHLIDGCEGALTLRRFGTSSRSGTHWMGAIVSLDWPPGTRQRRFDARGDQQQATYDQLLNLALFEFAKAWPECVV